MFKFIVFSVFIIIAVSVLMNIAGGDMGSHHTGGIEMFDFNKINDAKSQLNSIGVKVLN